MTKEDIKQRYKEFVLPETRTPYHFEIREEASTELLAYNPLCGDKYKLFLDESAVPEQVHYHGIGCALSKASGSMMIKALEGKSQKEAQDFIRGFIRQVAEGTPDSDLPENLRVLVELKNFEGREDCITLMWKALLTHLETEAQQ